MIDDLLKTHLEPIARDQRRWRLVRALTFCYLAASVVGLSFLVLYLFTGWISAWIFVGLAGGTLAAVAIIWIRNRVHGPDYRSIARRIEAEHPRLHALLLTAVEQKPDRATGQLNYLQERVIKEALAEDPTHNWHARTTQQLDVARLGNVVAFMVLAGILVPLYRSAPPRANALFHPAIANGLTVTPGDAAVEKGSSVVILARFQGDVPAEVTLVAHPANEPERRIALVKNLDDPLFGTSLSQVNNELTYRVEYKGATSRDFRLTTFEFPRLEKADAKVTYPDYTGIEPRSILDTRRVSAVEGSTLDYTFHLNKPVRSAELVAKDAPPISLTGDAGRSNVYSTSLKMETSRRYELLLVDDAGRTNKLPPLFVLEVLTNRTPELKFAFPRGDQRVSALEEIAFRGEASDDFGLKAYGIAYNLAGEETRVIQLGTNAGALEKRTFDHTLALETLGAQVDQLLSYYIWADDMGPDGKLRRTSSDMFFAEVRPFEEIFREGQAAESPQQSQQQRQQGRQNGADRLAELQKQIINATWNLQRRERSQSPSAAYKDDTTVVKDSQEKALEQVQTQLSQADDPRSSATLETVQSEMEKAIKQLTDAADSNSLKPLPPALSAEQSAYQALLGLAAREHQVAQNRSGQSGQSSRGARAQRQLNQLDLKQANNRYETQSQAAPPQDPQQREQIQAFNRLKELAQRQQDINERLKELQAALQEAKTATERDALNDRLKRLQEEQRQMLADVDELRQRMDRPENQSQMSDARQQLDQTRSEVQKAAESMEQGAVSQAVSSATRAQRDLQQMRDDFRQKNSSQFADDMRQLRNQARELAQKEEEAGKKIDTFNDPTQQKKLTDSDERKAVAAELDEQKKRIEELVQHATDVTQKAEPVEPLLSRQLYDTLRKASQDDARDLQETSDALLDQGRRYRSVYERLETGRNSSKKAVEVAAELLRDGFPSEANQLEERARRSINELKGGIEHAAESVLGNDTEALRLAQRELDELSRQLEREIARGQAQPTNSAPGARAQADAQSQQPTPGNRNQPGTPGSQNGEGRQPAQNQSQPGQGQNGNQPSGDQPSQNQPAQNGQGQRGEGQNGQAQNGQDQNGQGQNQPGRDGQGQAQAGNQPGQNDERSPGTEQTASNQSGGNRGQGGGRNPPGQRGGQQNFFDQMGGNSEGGGGGAWGGPITGPEYTRWSDRLRDVEEMLDVPELRTQAAQIRDRARALRLDLKRHSNEPQWDVVNVQIAGPLSELRTRVVEELARRESKEALVPIDRDPVPSRYSELVRHYYEQLGKSETAPAPSAEGSKQ